MTLGERIKRLRKLNDMSQQQLADYLEINRNYLSRIETNKSEPTSSIILKLTALFEITANELLPSLTLIMTKVIFFMSFFNFILA